MLKHAISLLNQEIDKHQRTLAEYYKLQNIGFGLRELILLNNTIREIATSNNIDSSMAVKKFFQDMEEKNAQKLGNIMYIYNHTQLQLIHVTV